jgi:phosphoribosylaminoimidazolecarboxamide formyltransferase / IMP cyclohydrolase
VTTSVLRYGSNPSQPARLLPVDAPLIDYSTMIGTPPLSHNDILNIDVAVAVALQTGIPCTVAVKHALPLGAVAGCAGSAESCRLVAAADPAAARDGTILLTRSVDASLADQLRTGRWALVAAPGWSAEAEQILERTLQPGMRVVGLARPESWPTRVAVRSRRTLLDGSILEDGRRPKRVGVSTLAMRATGSAATAADAALAWGVAVVTRSNAAVVASAGHILAVAAGHHDGDTAVSFAAERAESTYAGTAPARGRVLATDGALPYGCDIGRLVSAGIQMMVLPTGVAVAHALAAAGIVMVETGQRAFAH